MSYAVPLVVPTHKPVLSNQEFRRILINKRMNSSVVFVIPSSNFNVFNSNYGNLGEIVTLSDKFFSSRESYNRMLLSQDFWQRFLMYEKVIICQTDATLIKPTEPLNDLNYSFIGAPWKRPHKFRIVSGEAFVDYRRHSFHPYRSLSVGNGGLSLRNVSSHLQVLRSFESNKLPLAIINGKINEDLVFSYLFKIFNFPLPSATFAGSIFLEETVTNLTSIPDVFGFHALSKFNPNLENMILNSI